MGEFILVGGMGEDVWSVEGLIALKEIRRMSMLLRSSGRKKEGSIGGGKGDR